MGDEVRTSETPSQILGQVTVDVAGAFGGSVDSYGATANRSGLVSVSGSVVWSASPTRLTWSREPRPSRSSDVRFACAGVAADAG